MCSISVCLCLCVCISLPVSLCLSMFTLWFSVSLCGLFSVFICMFLCINLSQYVSLVYLFSWHLIESRHKLSLCLKQTKDVKARDFTGNWSDWYSLRWLGQPVGILSLLHHFPHPSEQWNCWAWGAPVSLSALQWTHSIRHTCSGLFSNSHNAGLKTPHTEGRFVIHFSDLNHKIILLACTYHHTVMSLLTPYWLLGSHTFLGRGHRA